MKKPTDSIALRSSGTSSFATHGESDQTNESSHLILMRSWGAGS